MMSEFGLLTEFTANNGEQEKLRGILLEAATSMELIDDCKVYVVQMAQENPEAVYVYEIWRSVNAHKASLSHEVNQKLIAKAKPIIKDVQRINTFAVEGGKGL
ncbi:putative quinol monooxygenase [Gracilibacillus salinarum]|uniref:Antibiotic biosynthesis monooxygenase n=1 Tax=Gracilibacillus salinarum TaxID=2932255 RepID=A0ABY4GPY3_9BACI|nr:antibiotic biosynthesis monooxygenase family protein [Gracilibacillus salinarum]UOQ85772.1 antibiotic biosynthesis monooxygenase [Gracilibacillus salinarum]